MKSAQTHVIRLTYYKSTPGTHVFNTAEKGVAVKSIYVAQGAFETPPKAGDTIVVTVET